MPRSRRPCTAHGKTPVPQVDGRGGRGDEEGPVRLRCARPSRPSRPKLIYTTSSVAHRTLCFRSGRVLFSGLKRPLVYYFPLRTAAAVADKSTLRDVDHSLRRLHRVRRMKRRWRARLPSLFHPTAALPVPVPVPASVAVAGYPR